MKLPGCIALKCLDRPNHFTFIGKPIDLVFGKHQFAIDLDIEYSASFFDQFGLNSKLVL